MDKTALVTGASSGIGAACAAALAANGWRICLTARRQKRLEELTARINSKAGNQEQAIFHTGDITRRSDRAKLLQRMLDKWGRIDVLVNNAGIGSAGAVEDVDLEQVRELFEVNLFAAVAMLQLAAPVMRRQGWGRIINMSSVSGKVAFPGLGLYAASKFSLEAVSDAARREYHNFGIKVILIEPGVIDTEIWQLSRDKAAKNLEHLQQSPFYPFYQKQKKFLEKVVQSDIPTPDIVARAVCRAAGAKFPRARYSMPRAVFWRKGLACLPAGAADRLIRKSVQVKPEY